MTDHNQTAKSTHQLERGGSWTQERRACSQRNSREGRGEKDSSPPIHGSLRGERDSQTGRKNRIGDNWTLYGLKPDATPRAPPRP